MCACSAGTQTVSLPYHKFRKLKIRIIVEFVNRYYERTLSTAALEQLPMFSARKTHNMAGNGDSPPTVGGPRYMVTNNNKPTKQSKYQQYGANGTVHVLQLS